MPKRQDFDKAIRGLYNQFNQASGVPDGGLLQARNCNIDRPGILTKRRGFNRHGAEFDRGISTIFEFKHRLVVRQGATLMYDSDGEGTFTAWSGAFEAPDSRHALRSLEIDDSILLATNTGIYKNDTLTNDPVLAGLPAGLDVKLTPAGNDGWFKADGQVSYRIVWGREDDNKRLLLSEPSYAQTVTNYTKSVTLKFTTPDRVVVTQADHGQRSDDKVTISSSEEPKYDVTNASIIVIDQNTYRYSIILDSEADDPADSTGTASFAYASVELEFSVPEGLLVSKGDFYEIYRTAQTESFDIAPPDEHYKIERKKVTEADISGRVATYTDIVLESDLGTALYTNSSRDTISQENTPPPYAKDIAYFKNYVFVANVRYPYQVEIRMDESKAYDPDEEVPKFNVGDSLTLKFSGKEVTYTAAAVENIRDREFLRSTDKSTNAADTRETMKSLVRVINRHPSDSDVYAFYTSLEDDAPGKVLLKTRALNNENFSVLASSTTFGDMFEEEIPTSGTDVQSDNQERKNQVNYSKREQPESYPLTNSYLIGSENYPIHRILPLKDSLIVLKEDGIYRVTGQSANTFVVRPLDLSVSFRAAETAVVLNNAVFCITTQGIVRIDENGTQIISWPIEAAVQKMIGFSGAEKMSHAIAYESERKFILFTPKTSGDLTAGKAWVYNYLTKDWTTWRKEVCCAYVTKLEDKLYLGSVPDKFLLKERKTSANSSSYKDYEDESIPVTVGTSHSTGSGITTVVIAWTHEKPLRAGFIFEWDGDSKGHGVPFAKVTSVIPSGSNFACVLDRNMGWDADQVITGAYMALPIDSLVRFAPEDAGIRTMMKQFTYAAVSMESNDALSHELGFYNDVVPAREWVDTITLTPSTGWGAGKWDSDPWGDYDVRSTPVVTAIPRQHQRCRAMTLLYRHRTGREKFDMQAMSLTFRPYGGKMVRQSV